MLIVGQGPRSGCAEVLHSKLLFLVNCSGCTLRGDSLMPWRNVPCGPPFAATIMKCPGRRFVCMAFQIKDSLGVNRMLRRFQGVCFVGTPLWITLFKACRAVLISKHGRWNHRLLHKVAKRVHALPLMYSLPAWR